MITKYDLDYQFDTVAEVEVDTDVAIPFVKEAVEFWMGWEEALEESGGDYISLFLKNLLLFIMQHGRSPDDDEGWFPLDGSCGVVIKKNHGWRPDSELIDIQQRN